MRREWKPEERVLLGMLLWLLMSGVAAAATPPAKVVQQFIEAHLQGRFAEARGFTLEQANLRASLFSNWLFGAGSGGGDAATADVFLSRKFAQAFRYRIVGTAQSGENQVYVTVQRTSPNIVHMYTWALAPKRGAPPYDLIEAVDTYLTKVNFPVEESRVQFTLIREAGEWYISVIRDEKFVQFQQQWLTPQPLGPAAASPGTATPPPVTASSPPPAATTTTSSHDYGRQLADAQFNATLQSFNRTYQPPVSNGKAQVEKKEEKKSLLGKIGRLFGLGGKEKKTVATLSNTSLKTILNNIRDALARYTASNSGAVPDSTQIYDWQSLRHLVNQYGKTSLPATEAEAGFTFVRYQAEVGVSDYVLLIELHEPQDGFKRVEVTPYGFDRAG